MRGTRVRVAATVSLLLLPPVLLAAAGAQQPAAAPTFRSGTQIVEVDVRVLQNGRFVTDLTASDFRISENGVSQQVLSAVLIRPSDTASAAGNERAIATSAGPSHEAAFPQVWFFVF